MGIWDYFLSSRPGRKQEPQVPQQKEKNFTTDITDKMDGKEEFSVVLVQIDKGDVNYIHQLVGGKRTGTNMLGLIVPDVDKLYEKINQLSYASFESKLRIGSVHCHPDIIVSPLKLLMLAQHAYVSHSYEGRKEESQSIPSPSLASSQ